MAKKKIIRFISFVMLVLLFTQIMPNLTDYTYNFESNIQAPKVFLPQGSFHTEAIYIKKESQTKTISKTQSNNKPICIPYITVEGISAILPPYNEILFDSRKVIKQSILHYFNASKYKNNRL